MDRLADKNCEGHKGGLGGGGLRETPQGQRDSMLLQHMLNQLPSPP